MEKRDELYRGKAKSVYKTDDADRLILLFRNDTSAFDGKRIEQLDRKGMVNNKFNAFIMQKLEEAGVPTQFDKLLGDNECLVKKLDMIPVEERAARVKDFVKRLRFKGPVFEISALTREGCEPLMKSIYQHVKAQQKAEQPPEYVDPRFASPQD